jgi:hypothetical protein
MKKKISTEYDRMNPNLYQLLERLEKYSKTTYGAEAYALSMKEAALLLAEINYLEGALAEAESPGFCE